MPTDRFPLKTHNHSQCVAQALLKASTLCAQQSLRFTPIRKKVLELIWAEHAPVSAYALLEGLRQTRDNAQAPTIYRALDFLLQHGLVHKIESLNAYAGCDQPEHRHPGQFLICLNCQQIVELNDQKIDSVINKQAILNHFMITEQTIELKGYCSSCKP